MAIEIPADRPQQVVFAQRYPTPLPPTLQHHNRIPLPPSLPEGFPTPVLHPILSAGAPPLSDSWDMSTLPSCHTTIETQQPPWLAQPATYPPLSSMAIRVFDETRFRESERPIVVFPSDDSGLGVVSVRCLLTSLHQVIASQSHGVLGGTTSPLVWRGLVPSLEEREVWILHVG
ncbi:hypothetical protein NMY22_g7836 [Coprinellus aureogranulatus]|nr:hypothetical protein NMY22_g7836 [Coprinellus aureogranulatus]